MGADDWAQLLTSGSVGGSAGCPQRAQFFDRPEAKPIGSAVRYAYHPENIIHRIVAALSLFEDEQRTIKTTEPFLAFPERILDEVLPERSVQWRGTRVIWAALSRPRREAVPD